MRPRDVNKLLAAIAHRSKGISHAMERAVDRAPASATETIKSYLDSQPHQLVRRDLKALRRRLITPLLRRSRTS